MDKTWKKLSGKLLTILENEYKDKFCLAFAGFDLAGSTKKQIGVVGERDIDIMLKFTIDNDAHGLRRKREITPTDPRYRPKTVLECFNLAACILYKNDGGMTLPVKTRSAIKLSKQISYQGTKYDISIDFLPTILVGEHRFIAKDENTWKITFSSTDEITLLQSFKYKYGYNFANALRFLRKLKLAMEWSVSSSVFDHVAMDTYKKRCHLMTNVSSILKHILIEIKSGRAICNRLDGSNFLDKLNSYERNSFAADISKVLFVVSDHEWYLRGGDLVMNIAKLCLKLP